MNNKVLIRLRGCAGWSAPLLFAYGKSWCGSFHYSLSFGKLNLKALVVKKKKKKINLSSDYMQSAAKSNKENNLTTCFKYLNTFLSGCLPAVAPSLQRCVVRVAGSREPEERGEENRREQGFVIVAYHSLSFYLFIALPYSLLSEFWKGSVN